MWQGAPAVWFVLDSVIAFDWFWHKNDKVYLILAKNVFTTTAVGYLVPVCEEEKMV